MTTLKIKPFLMCPAHAASTLGGTPQAQSLTGGHIKNGSGWVTAHAAALDGLHGLFVQADAEVAGVEFFAPVHPRDTEDVDERREDGEDAQPDDDCLDEFHLGRLGGVGCNCGGRTATHEDAWELHLDGCGNAARHPVMNTLHASLFEAKTSGELCWAAKLGDQFCVGHDVLNAMCSQKSNAMCNNGAFTSASFGAMTEADKKHPSFERLMEAATEGDKTINNKTLAVLLQQSDQTITNWGARGVSKLGAMKAQEVFGCSANWVLDEALPKWVGADALQPPLLTKTLIDHAPENNNAASLLLSLAAILKPLTRSGRKAAAGLIFDAIVDPRIASSNAATLEGMVKAASEAIEPPPPAGQSVRAVVLGMKQTPHARTKSSTNRRKSGN